MWEKFTLFRLLRAYRAIPPENHAWNCLIVIGYYAVFMSVTATIQMSGIFTHDTSYLLNYSVKSEEFRLALLLSIFITFPMLVDTILDSFTTMEQNDEKMHWYSRMIFLGGVAVPNLFLLFFEFHNATAKIYILGLNYFRVSTFGCGLAYAAQIAAAQKVENTSSLIFFVFVLAMLAYTGKAFSLLLPPKYDKILSYISALLRTISLLLFFNCLHQFNSHKNPFLPKLGNISNNALQGERIYYLYLLSIVILNESIFLTSMYFNAIDDRNASNYCICTYVYLQMIFTVTVMILQGRIARMKIQNQSRFMQERQAFIRYISHEIRTPLNTVFLGLEFVTSALNKLYPLKNDENILLIIDSLGDIYCSCQISLSILNDLLTFDKMEGKKMTLELEYANCCAYVALIAKPFNVNAKEKNIIFTINYHNLSNEFIDCAVINIDHSKMGQVIRNLISNALKFTPDYGKVNVILSLISILPDDNNSVISDKDREKENKERENYREKDLSNININNKEINANIDNNNIDKDHDHDIDDLNKVENDPLLNETHNNANNDANINTNNNNGNINNNNNNNDNHNGNNSNNNNNINNYMNNNNTENYRFRVEVQDTGAGISLSNQKKLFGQYVQFDANKLQKGDGSGLGLWISKGIAELHGGRCCVCVCCVG